MLRINVICVLVICHMGSGMHTICLFVCYLSILMGYFLSVSVIVNTMPIFNLKRTKLKMIWRQGLSAMVNVLFNINVKFIASQNCHRKTTLHNSQNKEPF